MQSVKASSRFSKLLSSAIEKLPSIPIGLTQQQMLSLIGLAYIFKEYL